MDAETYAGLKTRLQQLEAPHQEFENATNGLANALNSGERGQIVSAQERLGRAVEGLKDAASRQEIDRVAQAIIDNHETHEGEV